jgi:hypothetical protein
MIERYRAQVGENLVKGEDRKRWDRQIGLGGNPRRRGGSWNLYRKKKMATWKILGRQMGGRGVGEGVNYQVR